MRVRFSPRRYWKYGSVWSICLSVGDLVRPDGLRPIAYCLESEHTGQQARDEMASLVENVEFHLNHKNFLKGFNIDLSHFNVIGTVLGDDWWRVLKKETDTRRKHA